MTEIIDVVRYVMALLFFVSFLPALLCWFLIHPFIGLWRKLGTKLTYAIVFGICIAVGVVLYQFREPALAVEYGTDYYLWPIFFLFYGISVWMEVQCRRFLKLRILVGVPEIDPHSGDRKLLTEGIYGKIRHPRYTDIVIGTIGWAFFINYLIVYLMLPMVFAGLYLIVLLEEKELRDRFGEEYVEYCKRVPRFIPCFGAA